MIQNALKKGLVPGELKIETYPNNDAERSDRKAARRMGEICATPEEVARYGYDQNGARNNNDRPGIPVEGYGAQLID